LRSAALALVTRCVSRRRLAAPEEGSAIRAGRSTARLSMTDATRILSAIQQGDPKAAEQLLPLVYDELRMLAARRLARDAPGQTLQATALVHEAYLRLVDGDQARRWDTQDHFFAAAAEAMRRILVERARRKRSLKRGGGLVRHDLGDVQLAVPGLGDDLLALDEALVQLALKDPVKAKLVELRHFAGLTIEEAAHALGLSTTTAHRYWTYARAWLHQAIRSDGPCVLCDPAPEQTANSGGKKRC
jgi:RNA polymerase sigma factor (TIGR02999 family)